MIRDSPTAKKLPKLSTTSYAILGFLSRRPMSAYELTQTMQNSLAGVFWSRTRSKLFVEPKKLVAHGLATAEPETTGRKRVIYSVTDAGREALRLWIGQPTQPLRIEAEVILKVLAARTSEPAAILRVLEEQLAANRAAAIESLPIMKTMAEEGMRFPDHAHLSAVGMALLLGIRGAVTDWLLWSSALFEAWDDTGPSEEKTAWATELYRSLLPILEELEAFHEGRKDTVGRFGIEDLPKFPLGE